MLGMTTQAVSRHSMTPNDITVANDFGTREAAEAFVSSDGLRAAMGNAGVQGARTIWFVPEA